MKEDIQLGLKYTVVQWALVVVGIAALLFLIIYVIFKKTEFLLCVKNVLRNKRRSILVLFAIAAAVMGNLLIGSYFLDSFERLRERTIRSQTGHLVLMKKGFYEEGGGSPSEYILLNANEIKSTIESHEKMMEYTKAVTVQMRFNGFISYGEKNINYIATAVDPDGDKELATQDDYAKGEIISNDVPYGIVLGEGLADQLDVDIGSDVTLIGSVAGGGINALDVSIQGIVKSASRDLSNVFVKTTLQLAQEMTFTEGANKVIMVLRETKNTLKAKKILTQIVKDNPQWEVQIYDWFQLQDFYQQVSDFQRSIFVVVSILLFGLVIFLVVNTITMSVFERFKEFGTLRAIGLKKRQLVSMVLLESVILSIAGIIAGMILFYGLGYLIYILKLPAPKPPLLTLEYLLDVRLKHSLESLTLITVSTVAIIGMTFLSAVLPGVKAAKTSIIDCLGHN